MEQESENTQQPNFGEAMMRVQGIMAEVSVLGANDYEMPALQRLLAELQSGDITPQEAIAKALVIQAGKMDYH